MNELESILDDCSKILGHHESVKEEDLKGVISIEDLLQQNDFEKHVALFEIPYTVSDILTIDEINASVSWYLKWKLVEKIENQNTCTIKRIFGYKEAIRVIVAINFYKYLRNKGYDPDIVEIFLRKQ